MEHRLHVLVRLDIDQTSARIEVSGCVTEAGWGSLVPVIDRTTALTGGLPVMVDLHTADHIEATALEGLQQFCSEQARQDHSGSQAGPTVRVSAPAALPVCRSVDSIPFSAGTAA